MDRMKERHQQEMDNAKAVYEEVIHREKLANLPRQMPNFHE